MGTLITHPANNVKRYFGNGFDISRLPGRSGASRPLSSLRTVRDSFPSHGSSIFKAALEGGGPTVLLPMQTLPGIHARTMPAVICSPYDFNAAGNISQIPACKDSLPL